MRCVLLVFSLVFSMQSSDTADIGLGILIEHDEDPQILHAIDQALSYAKWIISVTHNITLITVKINTSRSNAYAIQSACALISKGVVMVIGPITSYYADLLGWIFDEANIPVISPTATSPILSRYKYMFRMTGSDLIQGAALASIYAAMGWQRTSILTSSDNYGVQGLISFQHIFDQNKWKIGHISRLADNVSDAHITKTLRTLRSTGYRITVLHMPGLLAERVLNSAKTIKMTGVGWIYMVTDAITTEGSFNPVTPMHDGLTGTTYAVGNGKYFSGFRTYLSTTNTTLVVNNNLASPTLYQVADAVMAAVYAIESVGISNGGTLPAMVAISCKGGSTPTTWVSGSQYRTALLGLANDGINNFIQFSATSKEPEMYTFDLVNANSIGWIIVANYSLSSGYYSLGPNRYIFPGGKWTAIDYGSPLKGAHLRFVNIIEPPFVMNKKTPNNKSDIQLDELHGYLIDLIVKLTHDLDFTFTQYMVPDGNFGSKSQLTGRWNGMAAELVDRKADMSAGALTVTKDRNTDFDFTVPYIDLGLSIVMNKADDSVSTFKFIEPFSYTVWGLILVSFVAVAIAIGLLEKLSPFGSYGEFIQANHNMEYKCAQSQGIPTCKKIALEHLSMANSLWFSWSSLLQQGYMILPQAMSGKFVTVTWWMTVVIFVSMYTAKLGSYLIADRLSGKINSLAELITQDVVQYGTSANSAPYDMFCKSNIEKYLKVCENINKWGTVTNSNTEGLLKAQNSNGKCRVILVWWDHFFGRIYFALGLQKNLTTSPYNKPLSDHILALRQQGYMEELYEKWIVNRSECGAAGIHPQKVGDSASTNFGVRHMLGVFIVICAAACLALVILIIEWIVSSCKVIDTTIIYRPNTFCGGIAYRFDRLKRDFLVNNVPDKISTQIYKKNDRAMLYELKNKVNGEAMGVGGYMGSAVYVGKFTIPSATLHRATPSVVSD